MNEEYFMSPLNYQYKNMYELCDVEEFSMDRFGIQVFITVLFLVKLTLLYLIVLRARCMCMCVCSVRL